MEIAGLTYSTWEMMSALFLKITHILCLPGVPEGRQNQNLHIDIKQV